MSMSFEIPESTTNGHGVLEATSNTSRDSKIRKDQQQMPVLRAGDARFSLQGRLRLWLITIMLGMIWQADGFTQAQGRSWQYSRRPLAPVSSSRSQSLLWNSNNSPLFLNKQEEEEEPSDSSTNTAFNRPMTTMQRVYEANKRSKTMTQRLTEPRRQPRQATNHRILEEQDDHDDDGPQESQGPVYNWNGSQVPSHGRQRIV